MNNRTRNVIENAERHWLKLEIRHHYTSLQVMEKTTYELHLRLTRNINLRSDIFQWTDFENKMYAIVLKKKMERRTILNRKYVTKR